MVLSNPVRCSCLVLHLLHVFPSASNWLILFGIWTEVGVGRLLSVKNFPNNFWFQNSFVSPKCKLMCKFFSSEKMVLNSELLVSAIEAKAPNLNPLFFSKEKNLHTLLRTVCICSAMFICGALGITWG